MARKPSTVSNPWLGISWSDPVASIDKADLAKLPFIGKLQLETLPEPYTGNPDSQVYCLNMNPGGKDDLFESVPAFKKAFLDITQDNLCHKLCESMWFLLTEHAGYCWWRRITNQLRNDLGRNPRMFVVEYFPYHSEGKLYFPDWLPSYEYSDELIRQAMEEGKYILIMRYKEKWEERLKRIVGEPFFNNYENLFYMNTPRTPWFTYGNISYKDGTKTKVDKLLKQF